MTALEALGQLAWITDYEEDIASDLSVFHRIDDPGSMDSIDYLKKAKRLFAYKGVLRARLEYEQQQEEERKPQNRRGQEETNVSLAQIAAMTGGAQV